MADWTLSPIGGDEKAPGAINPPAPDQIKPTDPGWKDFVKSQIDDSGLKFAPECSVTLEIRATGKFEERPLDGPNPDDYDKELGWKEDRVYKTTPPEPYQDFTRWARRYSYMRTQKCVEYKAQVYVRCGAHFVARAPKRFFVSEGAPNTVGPVEIYIWSKTSGLEKDESGKVFEWEKTGKKSPPLTWGPEPYGQDIAHPQTTPPLAMINPPSWGVDFKLELGGSYKDWWPVEPKMAFKDWCKIEDLSKKDKSRSLRVRSASRPKEAHSTLRKKPRRATKNGCPKFLHCHSGARPKAANPESRGNNCCPLIGSGFRVRSFHSRPGVTRGSTYWPRNARQLNLVS